MAKFIKKPVEIEAIQYQWDDINVLMDEAQDKIADFIGRDIALYGDEILLDGIHGELHVKRGDWVIRQSDEDFYPCSDETFQAIYAPSETWLDRCRIERDGLKNLLSGLDTALDFKEKPSFITEQDWLSMFNQQFHMRMYLQSVSERIARNEPKPNFVEFDEVKPVEKEQGSESNLGELEA